MDNLPMPEEFGGGYQDGNNAINQWLCSTVCTNPNMKETYDVKFWASYIEKNNTPMKAEWTEKFGAKNTVDWMKMISYGQEPFQGAPFAKVSPFSNKISDEGPVAR